VAALDVKDHLFVDGHDAARVRDHAQSVRAWKLHPDCSKAVSVGNAGRETDKEAFAPAYGIVLKGAVEDGDEVLVGRLLHVLAEGVDTLEVDVGNRGRAHKLQDADSCKRMRVRVSLASRGMRTCEWRGCPSTIGMCMSFCVSMQVYPCLCRSVCLYSCICMYVLYAMEVGIQVCMIVCMYIYK
jgi:hypothetical protein